MQSCSRAVVQSCSHVAAVLCVFRYEQVNDLKTTNPYLKTLLAVGGSDTGTVKMSSMLQVCKNGFVLCHLYKNVQTPDINILTMATTMATNFSRLHNLHMQDNSINNYECNSGDPHCACDGGHINHTKYIVCNYIIRWCGLFKSRFTSWHIINIGCETQIIFMVYHF